MKIFTDLFFLCRLTFNPKDSSSFNIVSMSLTPGRLEISTGLSKSSVAANIGNDAFLLPEIFTLPFSLQGPLIINLSIFYTFGKVTPFWNIYLPFLSA